MKRLLAYQPGTSWMHDLHPLVKLAWLVLAAVWLLTAQPPVVVLLILVVCLLTLFSARIRFSKILGLRAALLTALFLTVLNAVFTPSLNWNERLLNAAAVGGRFLALILASQAFVLTTEPGAFAYALMRVGLPQRAGFALVNALRAVPLFEQDAIAIYNAQRARGAPYDKPGLFRHAFSLLRDFLFPMLTAVIRRAEALTFAMEARAFGSTDRRTYARQVDWRSVDTVVFSAVLAAFVFSIIFFIRS